ncbi:MAG: recombinase family protein, partial [Acidimicrobiales bacterium]
MEGMIQQTLHTVRHLAGATDLYDAGLDVLDDPVRHGGRSKHVGGSRMVWVECDGVAYLYSMGSAAATDLNDSNAFVSELVSALKKYRPREVWTQAFTRLIRAAEHAGDLLRAMMEHVEVLHCEQTIRASTPEGRMVFQVLTMISAAERDYLVRRHTAGRVAQWRRGIWIPRGFPPGYRLNADGRLELDPTQIRPVRKMFHALADPALTTHQVVARCAGWGITTPKLQEIHGEGATLADASNPSEVLRTLLGWVDTYRTGGYDLEWRNPFPGVEQIAGVAVEAKDSPDYPNGVLHLPYELVLPEDGWADDKTFEEIERRHGRDQVVTGASAHKTTAPLSGFFRYIAEDSEWALIP